MIIRDLSDPCLPLPCASGEKTLEVWGGIEYTRNRVRDCYFDQMEFSGHLDRVGDLDRIAELGIRTLRFGLLWDRHELDPAWRWTDQRLRRMQQLGLRPIAGLLHHGSGPPHSSLLDPEFPRKLAGYAASVAQRYPFVDAYTPVNEPHTTARFSCMYGVWYPHRMDRASYLRALLLQTKATVLSMQAIRCVRPDAKLVQTDDLGSIHSTEALRLIAEMMNERRWLPFDLLCGRVDRWHPMFRYIVESGISEQDVLWFTDHPCPPDILGVNYYVTSDRFLDHRTWLYPHDRRSAEGDFVDVEASRVDPLELRGFRAIIHEGWERYRIPVAITEVHLGGSVDQQIRWAAEAWVDANEARHGGVDCVAMTFWALLGSYDWNSLVTSVAGHYEPGAFDVSSGQVVQTALAELVHELASGRGLPDYALACPAWWRDSDRFCFAAETEAELAA
jgi:beta-glucosidase/6-phospho-beta-glucosidase/beta-galactosidase